MDPNEQSFVEVESLDPNIRRTFYVGLVAQSWALIETYIDVACEKAFLHLGGRDKFPDMPRSMSKKIKLLRHVYSHSEKLASLRAPTLRLLDCIADTASG